MKYTVRSPGSCGEFIQGYGDGHSFMVTCPIDRYAQATGMMGRAGGRLSPKAEEAKRRVLSYLKQDEAPIFVSLESLIPIGKGMASSTADISAVAQATALACGVRLADTEIARIALDIEPSDATFCKGIVQFDYREGRLLRPLGQCPNMDILIYDCGGEIDTMRFNERDDLIALQRKHEKDIAQALLLFQRGLAEQNLDMIGEAATVSAFANQDILEKPQLHRFYEEGKKNGGRGVICAHSGTVLGLIVPPYGGEEAKAALDALSGISYVDRVSVTNDGLIVSEEER